MSVVILRGDAARLPLPDASVDLIVTSPPYFGQRSYTDAGEIGSEDTPGEYIANLLSCTREWMRVLKPEGSIFVNLGDAYANDAKWGGRSNGQSDSDQGTPGYRRRTKTGIRAKSLMALPWRYALGCMDDLGLILRRDIIWSKANSMPESVTDRCRTSHEYLFHLVKQPRYFAAVDEIRQAHKPQSVARGSRRYAAGDLFSVGTPNTLNPAQFCNPLGALPGSVWEIASQPLTVPAHLGVDHYAAYPVALVKPVILGWSPSGVCTGCGEGRRPVASSVRTFDGEPRDDLPAWAGPDAPRRTPNGAGHWRFGTDRSITGYACACTPFTDHEGDAPTWKPWREHHFAGWAAPATRPAVCLDPFGGTGTTSLVADMLGRTGITVDRSADYCRIARWRTSDPAERARALGVPKPPPVMVRQGSLFDSVEEGEAS